MKSVRNTDVEWSANATSRLSIAAAGRYQGTGNINLTLAGAESVEIEGLAGAEHTIIDCQKRGHGFTALFGAPKSSLLKGQ